MVKVNNVLDSIIIIQNLARLLGFSGTMVNKSYELVSFVKEFLFSLLSTIVIIYIIYNLKSNEVRVSTASGSTFFDKSIQWITVLEMSAVLIVKYSYFIQRQKIWNLFQRIHDVDATYQSKSITPVDEYVFTLSKELEELAEKELGETEQVRNNAIKELRDWTMKNPRIIKTRLDAVWLLRFLRFKKFDIALAKEAIERYLIFRQGSYGKDWFEHLDILRPSTEKLLDDGYLLVLPNRDSKGRKVLMFRASIVDPSIKTCGYDTLIVNTSTFETLLEDEENQIRGIVHIADLGGAGMSHFTVFPPQKYYRMAKNTEITLAMRHKAFHAVNIPSSMKWIGTYIMSKAGEKISALAHLYSNFEEFDAIEKENLPLEYGGSIPIKEMTALWKKELLVYHNLRLKYSEMKVKTDMYPACAFEGAVRSLKYRLDSPELALM
ncbi:unnamed protein product [Diamesa serratosioi]